MDGPAAERGHRGVGRAGRLHDALPLRGAGVPAATQLAATYRRLVLQGPEGETRAATLAADVLAHLEKNDPDAALAALKTTS